MALAHGRGNWVLCVRGVPGDPGADRGKQRGGRRPRSTEQGDGVGENGRKRDAGRQAKGCAAGGKGEFVHRAVLSGLDFAKLIRSSPVYMQKVTLSAGVLCRANGAQATTDRMLERLKE